MHGKGGNNLAISIIDLIVFIDDPNDDYFFTPCGITGIPSDPLEKGISLHIM